MKRHKGTGADVPDQTPEGRGQGGTDLNQDSCSATARTCGGLTAKLLASVRTEPEWRGHSKKQDKPGAF